MSNNSKWRIVTSRCRSDQSYFDVRFSRTVLVSVWSWTAMSPLSSLWWFVNEGVMRLGFEGTFPLRQVVICIAPPPAKRRWRQGVNWHPSEMKQWPSDFPASAFGSLEIVRWLAKNIYSFSVAPTPTKVPDTVWQKTLGGWLSSYIAILRCGLLHKYFRWYLFWKT